MEKNYKSCHESYDTRTRSRRPLEPERAIVTYTEGFNYSMLQFPERKLVLPRLPKEEPTMDDLEKKMKDLKIERKEMLERKVKIRADVWRYFANEM